MTRKGLLTDKQKLIHRLEEEIGKRVTYNGAPSFSYTVGQYTVLRDGSLKSDSPDEELLKKLAADGLIEGEKEQEVSCISFPTEGFQGKHLVNLVNLLSVKGALINKAIGEPVAIRISQELVMLLKETRPVDLAEFLDCVHACGGEKAMRGLRISQDQIVFTGFTEENRILATLIVRASLRQGWSKNKEYLPVNEKYYFRGWLNSIGMKGEKYRETRERLLANLDGDGSFRTPEQREKFIKRAKRKKAIQPEFVLL